MLGSLIIFILWVIVIILFIKCINKAENQYIKRITNPKRSVWQEMEETLKTQEEE